METINLLYFTGLSLAIAIIYFVWRRTNWAEPPGPATPFSTSINDELIKDPELFPLADQLSKKVLCDFTDREQDKVLYIGKLIFERTEKSYLLDKMSEADLERLRELLAIPGWLSVFRSLCDSDQLSRDFSRHILENCAPVVSGSTSR